MDMLINFLRKKVSS